MCLGIKARSDRKALVHSSILSWQESQKAQKFSAVMFDSYFCCQQAVTEALCSILLLEESSPRQVFSEFILARKSTLQEIFHPSQHCKLISLVLCHTLDCNDYSLRRRHLHLFVEHTVPLIQYLSAAGSIMSRVRFSTNEFHGSRADHVMR